MTLLLNRWQGGDPEAEAELWPIVYGELERLAANALRRKGGNPTLQTTELVNEACLRLVGKNDRAWPSRGHFFAFSAKVMRHVLVDRARRRHAAKRPKTGASTDSELLADPVSGHAFGVLDIHQALARLSEISPRSSDLVELRFFGGLSVDEAAAALEISKATAVREWRAARAWLYAQLRAAV